MSRWCGALEGFYGEPYSNEARLALVSHLGSIGATDFAYAPKGDPFQRDRWREPYPADRLEHFRALLARGAEVGVRITSVISPGLDWRRGEDDSPLAAKLTAFYHLGVRSLGVAFDDVAPGGAELGKTHGAAVAGAVAALPGDITWSACPVDYAAPRATAYLQAFVAELPEQVKLLWTGPSIVAPTISLADLDDYTASLGIDAERVVLADNFPVNDGPMAGVLHLGPFPERAADLPGRLGGLLLNLMPGYPLASRIGLNAGVAWWQNPQADRVAVWRKIIAVTPGIEPLAMASRSWLTDPGPDPEIAGWDHETLAAWLAAGCRDGLGADWQSELEPWLQAWEWEAFTMAFAMHAAAGASADPGRRTEAAFGIGEAVRRLRAQTCQLFGIRYAVYPVTTLDGDRIVPDRVGVVTGQNLTDRICAEALTIAFGEESS